MGLQCRSTVTWTECVAAVAVEDGHVSPSSTSPTLTNSAQELGYYRLAPQNPGEWMLPELHHRTKEGVWVPRTSHPSGMLLSYLQQLWHQLPLRVWEINRISG